MKFAILQLFWSIVFNLKEHWYFCSYSWSSKNPFQNSSDLNFFLKWCCKISIMQFYRLFKKIIWKDIYVLQDDFINKALPFAKLSPWVCWWIWIFLSFLRKFHVSDFIPIETLCYGGINSINAERIILWCTESNVLHDKNKVSTIQGIMSCPVGGILFSSRAYCR